MLSGPTPFSLVDEEWNNFLNSLNEYFFTQKLENWEKTHPSVKSEAEIMPSQGPSTNPGAPIDFWGNFVKSFNVSEANADKQAVAQGLITAVPFRGAVTGANLNRWLSANSGMVWTAVAVMAGLAILKGRR